MGHYTEKVLQCLVKSPVTGIHLPKQLKTVDCHMYLFQKQHQIPSFVESEVFNQETKTQTHLYGENTVESYSGKYNTVLFTDDRTRKRWTILMKTKDKLAEALSYLVMSGCAFV